jgi:transcriptional regulator with XRE-family HTH domain
MSPTPKRPGTALGARLRMLREENGDSQWDMARRMAIRPNLISDWEVGRHEPTLRLLRKVAAAYDMTVASILHGVM